MQRLFDAPTARGLVKPLQRVLLLGAALGLLGCPAEPTVFPDAALDVWVAETAEDTSSDGVDVAPDGTDIADGNDIPEGADIADGADIANSSDAPEVDGPSLDAVADSDGDLLVDATVDTEVDAGPDSGSEVDSGPEVVADVVPDTAPDAPLSQFNGLSGQALRDALQVFTEQPHTPLGYTAARDAMYAFGGIDDDNGRIGCIYTGRTVDTDGSRTPGDNCKRADGITISCDFNTEHSWAKYYLRLYLTEFTPEYDAAEGDIHHLFPSDSNVNSKRWHFDFLDTDCLGQSNCAVDELSQLGLRPGVSGNPACPAGNLDLDKDCVMQVRPERQGDIARAQLYMAVRYEMPVDDATEAALRAWNDADPPDALEMNRNDGAESAQGNRNPFIDRPDFVALILDF